MAYELIENFGTQYALDWSVVRRLCMSYHRSVYQLNLANKTDTSESKWYNPLSWSMPTVRTIDVDWPAVRESARYSCDADVETYRRWSHRDVRSIAEDLDYRLQLTAINRRTFTNMLRDVQTFNARSIQEAVDDYDGLIEGARFIRDSSADIVVMGSTIATGGAAAGILAGGAALKGVYKYQDTGSAGAALLTGTGTIILGAFKVGGAKLSKGGEYTLIVAKGVLETSTSLVAGDSLGKAVEKGGLKIASASAAQMVFSAGLVKQVFERMPLPFTIYSTVSPTIQVDMANETIRGATKKIFERGTKEGAKRLLHRNDNPPEARFNRAGFADEVPIEQRILLNFGIVNMDKGIGHGW